MKKVKIWYLSYLFIIFHLNLIFFLTLVSLSWTNSNLLFVFSLTSVFLIINSSIFIYHFLLILIFFFTNLSFLLVCKFIFFSLPFFSFFRSVCLFLCAFLCFILYLSFKSSACFPSLLSMSLFFSVSVSALCFLSLHFSLFYYHFLFSFLFSLRVFPQLNKWGRIQLQERFQFLSSWWAGHFTSWIIKYEKVKKKWKKRKKGIIVLLLKRGTEIVLQKKKKFFVNFKKSIFSCWTSDKVRQSKSYFVKVW